MIPSPASRANPNGIGRTVANAARVNYRKKLIVEPDTHVHLSRTDTAYHGKLEPADARADLHKVTERLAHLQYLLYAERKHSVLIVLQAMDAGGKDGTVRDVFGGLNQEGVEVHSFKVPTPLEASHDFLWRAHAVTPASGMIAVFNRSYYEDVLVVRVHDLVPKDVWSKRYQRIVDFEKNLVQSGTTILKFFLHISPEEQLRRFKERLQDPRRQWKISESDYTERDYWDDYQRAYEAVLEKTSSEHAPWFIIPADQKWFRNIAVAHIVKDALDGLDMHYPPVTVDLAEIARRFHFDEEKPADPEPEPENATEA